MSEEDKGPWGPREFLERLRAVGRRAYHDSHPFHRAMNEGRLTPDQIRGWVANRFEYQRNIPIKDAAILSNCPDHEVRRWWARRLLIHDGEGPGQGGIEAWIRLGEAVGLVRHELLEGRHVLPGVARAVGDYVRLARGALADRGRILAHRAVRTGPHGRTAPGLQAALPLDPGLGDGLLPLQAHAGSSGLHGGLGVDPGLLHDSRSPGPGRRRPR